MGTFNELIIGGDSPRKIQFKHGLCWQLTYEIGDTIIWDGLKRPKSANGGVVVSGITSADYKGAPMEFFAIAMLNDRIISATEIREEEFDILDKIEATSPRASRVRVDGNG